MRHACQRYCEEIYRIGGKRSTRKNMKYYDSTMSTNMGKNILATMATITLKEAIPKFKGAISHGHPSSSNDEKTARTNSLSSHKDEKDTKEPNIPGLILVDMIVQGVRV